MSKNLKFIYHPTPQNKIDKEKLNRGLSIIAAFFVKKILEKAEK